MWLNTDRVEYVYQIFHHTAAVAIDNKIQIDFFLRKVPTSINLLGLAIILSLILLTLSDCSLIKFWLIKEMFPRGLLT